MKEALKFLNKPLTIRWYLFDSGYTTNGNPQGHLSLSLFFY